MMTPSDAQFLLQVEQCYSDGYGFYGNLDLNFADYRIHLISIVDKCSKSETAEGSACSFLKTLYTTDLYLSAACSSVSELAWGRFTLIYGPVIAQFARRACHSQDLAAEVAAAVLTSMFLPDRSGRSRIASFDGRCPLSAWIRVLVHNYAAKEGERKCNNLLGAECLEQVEDSTGILLLERSLRTRSYGAAITEALQFAAQSLTTSERKVLLLRYEEELQVSAIAREMEVSSACITRRIQAIQRKLRDQTIAALSQKGFVRAAIEECLSEILENVAYSILALVIAAA